MQALGEQEESIAFMPHCEKILNLFGVFSSVSASSTSQYGNSRLHVAANLCLVVHAIDLAVLSYAGAHLNRFDKEYLGRDFAEINVLSPFAGEYEAQTPSIKMRLYSLQCLDTFHGHQPVWIFSSDDWEPSQRLFLSAEVEVFADIWGPLWKAADHEKPNAYTRYVVGNGSILRWRHEMSAPSLSDGEVFCHWVSDHDMEQDLNQTLMADRVHLNFNGGETMLIGAVSAGCESLIANPQCLCSISNAREHMKDNGRLRILGAAEAYTYKDSVMYQLQVGYNGPSVSTATQYKRVGVQSLKKAFVELWTMEPEIRDPLLLEDFYGLEVSLCTHNAQRVQLARILGLTCMREYLKTFSWRDDICREEYFNALKNFRENREALRQLWAFYPQYRDEFGKAIMLCLKALEKTGINHKNELDVFLSSEATPRPELATLKPREHSWIGLLKDSVDSCCMAVFGDHCLEFAHKDGTLCARRGRSVLRTALVINQLNKPKGLVRKVAYRHEAAERWGSRWSVSDVPVGLDIWLGEHGTLEILSHLPEATLLMTWRASQIKTAFRNLFGMEKPHREYIEIDHIASRPTRPIPIFVMAHRVGEN
jgi:hypothetical protein